MSDNGGGMGVDGSDETGAAGTVETAVHDIAGDPGGGGGGAGRIRLNTVDGAATTDGNLTPNLASGITTVGTFAAE